MTRMSHQAMTNSHLSALMPLLRMRRHGGPLADLVTDLRSRLRRRAGADAAARRGEHELAQPAARNGDGFAGNALVGASLFWPAPPF
jgi:hypothetical protein